MQPSTPSVIVGHLAGSRLRGAITLDNGMLGLVFEDDRVLVINGTAYLAHQAVSSDVLTSARKRLGEAAAELETLTGAIKSEASVLDEATKMRDQQSLRALRNGECRRSVGRTIGENDEPPFLGADLLADQGITAHSETEYRARTEQIQREVPEVAR